MTTDLSPLNKFVIPDRHPLPHIEDLLVKLGGMRWFSKIDLRKGYFHIPLHLDSRRYTATLTPLGLMAYNRLPMGLKDAASAFQKCVSATLMNCNNTISFIDDILVYGRTREEHDNALEQWFPTTVPRRDCIRRYTPTYGSSSKEAPGATVPLTFTIIILYPVLNIGYVLYVNENFPYMIFIFYYFIAKRVYE